MDQSLSNPLDELLDRLGLIPFGFEFRDDFEIGHELALTGRVHLTPSFPSSGEGVKKLIWFFSTSFRRKPESSCSFIE